MKKGGNYLKPSIFFFYVYKHLLPMYNQIMNRKDFYNTKAWRKLATYIRHKHFYTCSICGLPGTYVHHIIPLNDSNYMDESISLSEDNLQLLCLNCHNEIHGTNNYTREDVMFDKDGQLIQRPPHGQNSIITK